MTENCKAGSSCDLPSKRAVAVVMVGESFELGSCQCREAGQFSGVLGSPPVFVVYKQSWASSPIHVSVC